MEKLQVESNLDMQSYDRKSELQKGLTLETDA